MRPRCRSACSNYTGATGWPAIPKGAWLEHLAQYLWRHHGAGRQNPCLPQAARRPKLMPNAINFGPAMPGKKYTAHNALEYQELPDLRTDMQMFTEMLVRIGNLKQMQ